MSIAGNEDNCTRDRGARSAARKMRVLLVDEQPTTRLGLRVLLGGAGNAEIAGECRSAEEAMRMNEKTRPDLVILDLGMGGKRHALEACKELKALPRPPRVLVYTARNSREDIAAASLAGADSYLHKGIECGKLPEVASKTHVGERIWLLGPAEEGAPAQLRAIIEGADLTPKESEVLALMVDRCANREIAEKLCLSGNTVKTHVRSILRKLGFGSRKELLEAGSP